MQFKIKKEESDFYLRSITSKGHWVKVNVGHRVLDNSPLLHFFQPSAKHLFAFLFQSVVFLTLTLRLNQPQT